MSARSGDASRGMDAGGVGLELQVHDGGFWRCDWLCEKWSEDAVNFARARLAGQGILEIQDGVRVVRTGEQTWDNILQRETEKLIVVPRMIPIQRGVTSDWLHRIVGPPEEVQEIHGNLLLNEGIQELEDLWIGAAGTTVYSNANARIGVGDSAAAEAATQTALQAVTNTLFKAMNATFPVRPGSNGAQSVDFKSDFLTAEANFVWAEWTIDNGATRNKNANRKVQALGTKTTGTWTLTGTVTIS